ncbi:hypothetical protein R6Q57_027979 [Mikania cordata]
MCLVMNREFVSRVWCIRILEPQEVLQMRNQGLKLLDSVKIQEPSDGSYGTYPPSLQESMSLTNGVTSIGLLKY